VAYPRRPHSLLRVCQLVSTLPPSLLTHITQSPSFPQTCLTPSDPGYGRVVMPTNARRRRRTFQAQEAPVAAEVSLPGPHGGPTSQEPLYDLGHALERPPGLRIFTEPPTIANNSHRYSPYPQAHSSYSTKNTSQSAPLHPLAGYSADERRRWSGSGASSPESATSTSTHSSPLSPAPRLLTHASLFDRPTLPPLSSLSLLPAKPLPPISSFTMMSHDHGSAQGIPDPATVLRRLRVEEQGGRRRQHASE